MIRRIGNITLGVVAAMVMACSMGCSRDGDQVVDVTTTTAISFDVAVADSQTISRAALTNSVSDLTEFNIYAVENSTDAFLYPKLDGVEVSKSGSSWNYSGTATWPEAGTVNFFAVAPTAMKFDKAQNVETRSLNYTVPTACDDQVDLMVDASAYTETGCGGVVPIEFEHALSAIRFSIAGDVSSSVTAIKISKVYGTATLTATAADGTFVWSDYADKGTADYAPILGTQKTPNADGSACIITTDEGYLMMLPQALPYDSQIEVEVATTLSDDVSWSRDVKYIPLTGDTWKSGYIYTYNLTVDAGEIDCELSVEPWNTSTVYFEDSDLFDVPMTQVINLDDYPTVEELEATIVERIDAGVTPEFTVYGSYYDGVFGSGETESLADYVASPFTNSAITSLDMSGVDMGGLTEFPGFAFVSEKVMEFLDSEDTSEEDEANFEGDVMLESIILPSGITEIGFAAFFYCEKLVDIDLSEIKTIGVAAFNSCNSFVDIEITAEYIGTVAFSSCDNLRSVCLPNATTLGDGVFCNNPELTTVDFPFVEALNEDEFVNCYKLESVNVPSVKVVGAEVFGSCNALTELYLPSVVKIDAMSFYAIDNIKIYLTSPDEITCGVDKYDDSHWTGIDLYLNECKDSDNAGYSGSDGYSTLYHEDDADGNPIWNNGGWKSVNFHLEGELSDINLDNYPTLARLNATIELRIETYETTDFVVYGSYYDGVFGDGTIQDVAPLANDKITSLDLSRVDMGEMTTLPSYAFADTGLTLAIKSITLPSGITTIGDSAFTMCAELSTLTGLGVTNVGSSAFYKCTSLTSIYLPEVLTIGSSAFEYCTSLTSIDMPNASTVASAAFASCTELVDVNLPEVTSIGNTAFNGCTSLDVVSFPVAEIVGVNAFHKCAGITSLYLPSAANIASSAFADWTDGARLYLTWGNLITIVSSDGYTGINLYIDEGKIDAGYSYADKYTYATDTSGNPVWNSISWKNVYTYNKDTDYSIIDLDGYWGSVGILTADLNDRIEVYDVTDFVVTGTYFDGVFGEGNSESIYSDAIYKVSPFVNSSITSLDFSAVDMGTTTELTPYAFCSAEYSTDNLSSVKLPSTITKIGLRAFQECPSLESISGTNVEEVGDYAFALSSITEIDMPSIKYIGTSGFAFSLLLENVDMPKVITVGDLAFAIGFKLTSVTLDSAEVIGERVFYNCTKLTSVSLPSATSIGDSAFSGLPNGATLKLTSPNAISIDSTLTYDDYTGINLYIHSNNWVDGTTSTTWNGITWKSVQIYTE